MNKDQTKQLAKELFESGLSLREISAAIEERASKKVSFATVRNWAKDGGWIAGEKVKIVPLASTHHPLANKFEDMAVRLETAGQSIGSVAMANIEGAAIAQQLINNDLTRLHKKITEEDREMGGKEVLKLNALVRAQTEVTKTLQAAWQSLEVAGRIAEFMAENISVEIEFQEYTPEELAGAGDGG